jgi:hypothetical protein
MLSQTQMTATMETSKELAESKFYDKLHTAVPVPAPLNHSAGTGAQAGAVRLNGAKGLRLGPQLQRPIFRKTI